MRKILSVFLIFFLFLSSFSFQIPRVKASPDSDTWQVGASADDSSVIKHGDTTEWSNTRVVNPAGYFSSAYYWQGSAMLFTNITIEQGDTIDSAYLNLTSYDDRAGGPVNTRVSAHDVDNATNPTDVDDFLTKWGERTSAIVDWDNIPAWSADEYGSDTFSPDIKTVIQEIVNRAGWSSGNSILLFWEDLEHRTSNIAGRIRRAYSYDSDSSKAPYLDVSWKEGVIHYLYSGLNIIIDLTQQRSGTFTRESTLNILIQLATTTFKHAGEIYTIYSAIIIQILLSTYIITPEVTITGLGIAMLAFVIALFGIVIALTARD